MSPEKASSLVNPSLGPQRGAAEAVHRSQPPGAQGSSAKGQRVDLGGTARVYPLWQLDLITLIIILSRLLK